MLAKKLKIALRTRAHHLKPTVLLGQHGHTPAVSAEIDRALTDHELIKIKIAHEDRIERKTIAALLCQALNASLIQSIGKVFVLYRKNPETELAPKPKQRKKK